MRLPLSKVLIVSAILVSLAGHAPAETAQDAKKSTASSKHHSSSGCKSCKTRGRGRRARKGAWRRHGQQVIQPERATAIQQALIREKYLTGEPSGKWDDRTQAAMARYQADHGWQSKITPDSRALIKLGLGPDYSDKNMMLLAPKAVSDPVAATAAGAGPTSKQP